MSCSSPVADDVLLIDDDKDVRESLAETLAAEGLRVHTAADGTQAIEALLNRPSPCVILLDLMMPGMNGWEFLAQKELSGFLASIPVVIMSAVAPTSIPGISLPGIADWLRKPVRIDDLLAKISEHCVHIGK